MDPVLRKNQVIFVNKAAYGLKFLHSDYFFLWAKPEKGDIVVFRSPADNSFAVKRCIGSQGDTIRTGNSGIYIGGTKLELSLDVLDTVEGYNKIPKGHIFVIGDNRDVSLDSRMYGFLPINKVIGKVMGNR